MAVNLNGKVIKAGARHSAADVAAIQSAHDQLVKAGATCGGAVKTYTPPLAIKSVGGGKVEGLLVRYTDPRQPDLVGDYFDRQSDLGVKDGQELITLWHHGLDATIGKKPIGKGVVKYTDAGLWYQTWLDRRDEYEQLILQMIELGKAGYSGGASDIVRQGTDSRWPRRVVSFPLIEGSITPTPMDPGNVVSLKSFMGNQRGAQILRRLDEMKEDALLDVELDLDWLEQAMRIEAELDSLR